MKTAVIAAAGVVGVGAGLMACSATPVTVLQTAPASHSSSAPSPAPTKTVVKVKTVQAATPTSTAPAPATTITAPAAAPAPTTAPTTSTVPQQPDQNVTDPWAVVSAYYGDIESGNYAQAYALIGNGATTGQSYQEFVAGFSCTGAQDVSENWESGDQVNFDLAATDSCNGVTQQYTGTDTVQHVIIVAADVVQTG